MCYLSCPAWFRSVITAAAPNKTSIPPMSPKRRIIPPAKYYLPQESNHKVNQLPLPGIRQPIEPAPVIPCNKVPKEKEKPP